MKYNLIVESWNKFISEEITTSSITGSGENKPAEVTTGQSEEEKKQAQKHVILTAFEADLKKVSNTARTVNMGVDELKPLLQQAINNLKESKAKKSGDRCTRIAKRKYKVWPSAYASGAVVKCRQGKIWKGISESATDEEIDLLLEKWSKKYKRSIDCKHPKGFSQKAHCQGRKKNEELELDKDVIEEQNYYIKSESEEPILRQILDEIGLEHYHYKIKFMNKYHEYCPYGFDIEKGQNSIILKVCTQNEMYGEGLFWETVKDELESMIQSGSLVNESKKKVKNNVDVYEQGKKYNQKIPEIRFLPINVIKRQEYDFRPETLKVSDDVAKKMDFSQPIEVTAYRFPVTGWGSTIPPKIVHLSEEEQNDDTKPDVMLIDGHHRLAAAIQTGRSYLPVEVTARNAKGEKLNALIQLSQKIEKQHNKSINEKKDYKPNFSKEKEQGLHGWFARNKGKGWINCRTGGPCGRSDSDEGGKYPACRPTKAQCKSAGKGPLRKKKSSKPISWTKKNKKD